MIRIPVDIIARVNDLGFEKGERKGRKNENFAEEKEPPEYRTDNEESLGPDLGAGAGTVRRPAAQPSRCCAGRGEGVRLQRPAASV